MLPRYARAYEKEFQRYDRFLRLRRSIDEYPGRYVLERKTRYTSFPDGVERGTDRAERYASGYRLVFPVASNELRFVMESLALSDIQRQGGAKALANRLDEADDRAVALAERARLADLDAVGSDVYDHLAWREGRRVSFARR